MSGLLRAGIGLVIALVVADRSMGDVTTVELPEIMVDFAINPETGDIAAVDSQNDFVYLFRAEDLEEDNLEDAPSVRVGS